MLLKASLVRGSTKYIALAEMMITIIPINTTTNSSPLFAFRTFLTVLKAYEDVATAMPERQLARLTDD